MAYWAYETTTATQLKGVYFHTCIRKARELSVWSGSRSSSSSGYWKNICKSEVGVNTKACVCIRINTITDSSVSLVLALELIPKSIALTGTIFLRVWGGVARATYLFKVWVVNLSFLGLGAKNVCSEIQAGFMPQTLKT